MGLDHYDRKRDFTRSPEPKGAVGESATGRLYLIQKHAARALHYDLRLELDGVLKSWAVPKGPSLDPSEKRLAVHVEDHPIEYGAFEGVIPEGEYGGGTVQLWDRGEWEPLGDPAKDYRRGRLSFRLHGQRLRGAWSLARMRGRDGDGDNWLLIKKEDEEARSGDESLLEEESLSVATGRTMAQIASDRDRVWGKGGELGAASPGALIQDLSRLDGARPAPMPEKISPQLATLVDAIPTGDAWLHEVKFDGYRIVAVLEGGGVRLWTRNGLDWTDRFAEVAEGVAALPIESAVLDGEVVVLDSEGRSDFQALQNVLKGIERGRLVYYLFDLVHCLGYDLSRSPLVSRKELLRKILLPLDSGRTPLRYSDHIVGDGARVFRHACRYALEGVVSKKVSSPYVQRRSGSWVKIKCIERQEFIIGGFSSPSGSRTAFGALLVGVRDDAGRLLYAGKVGTGFNDETLRSLGEELEARVVSDPPFVDPPKGREADAVTWVLPELVAEIEFTEWTREGHLRHPSFKGLREDKAPGEIVMERAKAPEAGSAAATDAKGGAPDRVAGVALTNPERVMYPQQGVTKRDLALYYETVASRILPFIAGRPLTVVRCPQGRQRKCFYQKHLNESVPPPVRGVAVKEAEGEGLYLVIDDVEGLITLVQLGVLEFHPWGSREDRLEFPDQVIFDLDPGPGIAWEDVLHCARQLHDRLAALDLASYVKTSGGKGLHVAVPLTRRSEWKEVKAFSQAVSEDLARREPKRYVTTMSKSLRQGRIFIDFFRNSRGATSIAPYSTRARAGAPVSTPLHWHELSPDLGPADYTLENLPRRLQQIGEDPWKDFFKQRQSITRNIRRELGF